MEEGLCLICVVTKGRTKNSGGDYGRQILAQNIYFLTVGARN